MVCGGNQVGVRKIIKWKSHVSNVHTADIEEKLWWPYKEDTGHKRQRPQVQVPSRIGETHLELGCFQLFKRTFTQYVNNDNPNLPVAHKLASKAGKGRGERPSGVLSSGPIVEAAILDSLAL